jgi:hypothetical protein
METVNTVLKDGVYVPESIEMDPYSEFKYADDRNQTTSQGDTGTYTQQAQQTGHNPLNEITKNIDQFFDGVDMFFNVANQIQRRINGGQNVRRRRSV